MNDTFLIFLASTYNCQSYGAGTYGSQASCTATSGGGSSTSEGGLANTGEAVYIPLIAGVLLIVLAIALLIATLRRRNKKS